MAAVFELEQFPSRTYEKLRYRDTDHNGHVNNAVFSTMLEAGRVDIFFAEDAKRKGLPSEGCTLVVVSLSINFLAELLWPGTVEIGTRITKIGRSSVTIENGLFQNARCCATGITVVAQVNLTTKRSQALDEISVEYLKGFMGNSE